MKKLLDHYLSKHSEKTRNSGVIAFLASLDLLFEKSPSIARHIVNELTDQRHSLKLIASENYSSLAVQAAMGNLLTDKYCEGIPYHRFYAGCEHVDAIEAEAAELAQSLFEAEHAYVQPHSGADANLVAFWAILTEKIQSKEIENLGKKSIDELSSEEYEKIRQLLVNQTVMGLALSSGGHLTHGFRHNISSKMMRAVTYDVDPQTELMDYGAIRRQARKEKPLILIAGYSSYPRLIDFSIMREIADEVGATLLVDMAHFAGLVAGKVFTGPFNPIPYAHVVTSTTHKTLRGPRGGLILCSRPFVDAVNRGCPLALGGPLPHVIAAKAVAFKEANTSEFAAYSKQIVVNAQALAEGFMRRGIRITTGGTDNHLIVLDLTSLGLTGRLGETAIRQAGITSNRNMIPFDPQGAWYTSGIRMGTAALTTLGMGVDEMDEIADITVKILKHTQPLPTKTGEPSKAKGETDQKVLSEAKNRIQTLLKRFPLYPEIEINTIT